MAVPFATLGSRRVSEEDPCYIIAEIGVNHNGDVDLAQLNRQSLVWRGKVRNPGAR